MTSMFLNPGFLLAVPLIAIPIAIHLLSRLRQKRVRWAAMEFILESQRRNERRIFLEQLLLLTARCLLVAGIALILARPLLSDRAAGLIGLNQSSDHVFVLDDSYSMGESLGAGTVFDEAVRVIEQWGDRSSAQPGASTMTLLRTSAAETPDLLAVPVGPSLAIRLREKLTSLRPSFLAGRFEAALAKAESILGSSSSPNRVLTLVSDFRARDWGETSDALGALHRMSGAGVRFQLVDVAGASIPNLGISRCASLSSLPAANIPFVVEARVHNYSNQSIDDVPVTPRVDGRAILAKRIARIAPGETEKVRFDVLLPKMGIHEIDVELPADALEADNRRTLALALPDRAPVLVIDGSAGRADSRFLALALAPGGEALTGLDPVIREPEFLTRAGALDPYAAILLLDVPFLDRQAVQALLAFTRHGRGVGMFVGDQVQAERYNQVMGPDGLGFLPFKLGSIQTPATATSPGPDLRIEPHPVFRVFQSERNPFLETVRISKLFGLQEGASSPKTSVIARFRDGAPLVIETPSGKGRVIVFLTTAGPRWNNWARNPSYVVAMLELCQRLAAPVDGFIEHRVGEPWRLEFPASAYRNMVEFTPPGSGALSESVAADLHGLMYRVAYSGTARPGAYRMSRTAGDGLPVTEVRAYNVDPAEGDLRRIERSKLADRLVGINYSIRSANEAFADDSDRSEPRDWLILAFVAVLVFEQWLAYRMSYVT